MVRPSSLMNGATAGAGVALIAIAGAPLAGDHAGALLVGAICASVPDTPSPLPDKLKRIALACGIGAVGVFLASATAGLAWAHPPVVLVVGFAAAMTSAFGRSAIPVGVSILLALVLAGTSAPAGAQAWQVTVWFLIGNVCFAAYTAIVTPALSLQTKHLLVQEALQALATYLRAQKQALDDGAEQRRVYARLIDAQAVLAERIQAARNVAFVGIRTERDQQVAAELLVTIDCLEAALSEQADLDTLLEMRGQEDRLVQTIRGLLLIAASDLDRLARSVRDSTWREAMPIGDRAGLLQKLKAIPRDIADPRSFVLYATADKLDVLFAHLDQLNRAQNDPALGKAVIGSIDLTPFVQSFQLDWRSVGRELHRRSPVLRFALRLSAAMFCGAVIEGLLPYSAHGSWILLTVALVMRASFSVTRQRRRERLLGNLIGCLLAPLIILAAPEAGVAAAVFISAGTAHAFAAQSYMVASVASCVMALLQIHLQTPAEDVFFFFRVIDTAIGGMLAYAFSFLLPYWEHQTIGRAVRDLLSAQETCASHALRLDGGEQDYRLSRRRVFDALVNLSSTVSRMLEEPGAASYRSRSLSEFLAASYVFAAELASVQVFVRSRAAPGDLRLARAVEASAHMVKARFALQLSDVRHEATLRDVASLDIETYEGAGVLARRLRRVIQVAERVRKLGLLALETDAAANLSTASPRK